MLSQLKNFGVVYRGAGDVRLSPLYDVVTTAIYRYTRYEGGPELEDRTLALRLFRKSQSKTFPLREELLHFGRRICGVQDAEAILRCIAQAMSEVLEEARVDERIPRPSLAEIHRVWQSRMAYAGH